MAYTPGTLHVLRSTPDGRFPEGAWVRLVPSVPRIHDLDGRLVLSGAVTVELAKATVEGREAGEASVSLPPTHGMDPDPVTWTAHVTMPGSLTPEPPVEGIVITSGQITELAAVTPAPTPVAVPNVQRTAEAARDEAVAAAASVRPGVAGGVATLDPAGRLPEGQIPERLSAGVLTAQFAPTGHARPGNRWVALGDSITAGAFDNASSAWGESWVVYAMLVSQGRLRLVRNAGIPGNVSGQMLARFDADVAPYAPNIVTILAGTNDIGTGVAVSTFKANIISLVDKVRRIGAVPVLATIPPRDQDYNATIVLWNTWLRDYAERNGVSIMDFYRSLIDPSNGHFAVGLSGDGTHPSPTGNALLGEVAAWVLTPLTPVGGPLLPADATDTNDLLGGKGLFLTAAGGVGTGWSPGSAPSGVTKAVVADPGILGNVQRITMTNAAGLWTQQATATPAFTPGDRIRVVGMVSSSGVPVTIQAAFTGGSPGGSPLKEITRPITRGAFCQDITVPAGATALTVKLACGAAAATGVVDFGQVGAYNLTAMGVSA